VKVVSGDGSCNKVAAQFFFYSSGFFHESEDNQNWRIFNVDDVIDLGSLKINVARRKALNRGT
jgi:hypothetical protein